MPDTRTLGERGITALNAASGARYCAFAAAIAAVVDATEKHYDVICVCDFCTAIRPLHALLDGDGK